MSKWDKYRVESSKPINSGNRWDKYRIQPSTPEKSLGQNINEYADVAGKSFNRGAIGLLDLPQLVGTGIEELGNLIPGGTPTHHVSSLTPLSQQISNLANKGGFQGFNKPKTDTMGKRIVGSAFEGAGSALGGIGLGAGATKVGMPFFSKFLGSPQEAGKLAKMGATLGGTSGVLQETGMNPLVADIGAAVATPYAATKLNPKNIYNAFKKIPETAAKLPIKLMGLGPKGLNIEAAQAARDLGIDLPAAALTESRLTNLADQYVGKTPHFGEKLGKKYTKAQEQTKDALEKIYEEIGPKKTPEIKSKISNLYKERREALPKEAAIIPENTIGALDNIKINSAILSKEEKELLQAVDTLKNELNPALNSAYGTINPEYGKINIPPQRYSIDRLMGTKQSLNKIIKWDLDEGVKNQLRNVQENISKDIAEYGKTNPEWYTKYKEADKLFSETAKRKKIEEHLSGSINPSTDDLGYAALSKRIHVPKQMELIKKQVTPEVFSKIEKLGKVARAMAIKNRNIPNPSGTAITGAISGVLGTLYTPQAITAVIGTAGTTKLLTDKKFLDLALKFAENPKNLNNSTALSNLIKKSTGYSPIILEREINRQQENRGQ